MRTTFFTAVLFVFAVAAHGADSPQVPEKPIAVKKELLFSDDFESADHSPLWHKVVPTFAFENGMLKGTQTRDTNVPAAIFFAQRDRSANGTAATSVAASSLRRVAPGAVLADPRLPTPTGPRVLGCSGRIPSLIARM